MPEINSPPCPIHGAPPRSLHTHNFAGIVQAVESIINTISGVGTISYTRCAYGYPSNFEGVVRVLEDLNASISGITPSVLAGSGIYLTSSGVYNIINANYGVIVSGALIAGTNVSFDYDVDGKLTINTAAVLSGGSVAVNVQGTAPPSVNGTLWFDTNQGRLFVYASGAEPGWYVTNTEAIVNKGEAPPSGDGLNAPPRDGSIWWNSLLGSLFVYDIASSGWYESSPSRSFAYSSAAPAPSTEGAGWYSTTDNALKVWNGTSWVSV